MSSMARSLRTAPSTARIVGRGDQLERLRGLLDEVVSDGSRFVLIGGDAGSGKTTVVRAFAAQLGRSLADRKAQLVSGQCVPLGGDGLPYAPVAGALRELVELHGREQILDWAGAGRVALGVLLPDLISAPTDTDAIRLRLFEAVARLCERASERGPLVVVMEDIHWADESTRHLLRFLVRALTDAPVLVVATYRTDELTRRHPLRPFLAEIGRIPGVARLEVPSLERFEVAELLTTLLGHAPSAVVTDLVHRRSEGIPYFVEELAQSAARGCVDMPDTLRDALSVRISALSDEALDTLRLAAVAGNRVDHQLLESVSNRTPAELEADLREAVDAAVLLADETGYAFRHALLREVVHDDMLPGQHARLHARFAQQLEERPDLAGDSAALETAHHWSAAHDVAKAFTWSIRAAGSRSAAHFETLKLYERALELWDQVPEAAEIAGPHVTVLDKAMEAARDAGEIERALVLANAALAETDPDDLLGRIRRLAGTGELRCTLMKPGSVEALTEAAALLPEDAPPKFSAVISEQLARITLLAGRDATEVARAAVKTAGASGSAAIESNARNTLGVGLVNLGHEEEGLAELKRAGELGRDNARTMLRYYVNYSDALTNAGRYDDAVREAMNGIEVAGNLGLERSLGAMLVGNAAEPLLALGEWSRAEKMMERALELDPPAHQFAQLQLLLAWLRLWQGDLEQADALVTQFRGLMVGDVAAPQYAGLVSWVDSELAMATGDLERAWHNVENALEHRELHSVASQYPLLRVGAAAAHALDQLDSARGGRVRRIRSALDTAGRSSTAAFWRAVIEAELTDGADAWRSARRSQLSLPGPRYLRPYAGLRLAQHLVAQRERVEAREVLIEAATEAHELGAGLLGGRIGALAQRAGFSLSQPGSAPSALATLTPRELEVLELVAAGRSNGDIGAALFISTKTASVHVSNILAKLGVASRGEAAALAHRVGLEGTDRATGAEVIALRPA